MVKVEMTGHAEKRLKERFGIKRKAALRYAEKAFKRGIFPQQHHDKVIAKWYQGKQDADYNYLWLLHDGRAFVFGLGDNKNPVLVTVYPIASKDQPEKIQYSRGKSVFRKREVAKFRDYQNC